MLKLARSRLSLGSTAFRKSSKGGAFSVGARLNIQARSKCYYTNLTLFSRAVQLIATPTSNTSSGPQEVAHLLHVLPGGALQGGIPQQGRRVVGDHGGDALHPEPLAAHAADGGVVAQQGLGRDPAEGDEDPGADERDLPVQVAAAGGHLVGLGIAVARRPALHHVGD